MVNFGPISTCSVVRGTFLAEEEPKILNFHPTRNFGHFWAAFSKMSAPSPHGVHCLLCLQKQTTKKDTGGQTMQSMLFGENVAGLGCLCVSGVQVFRFLGVLGFRGLGVFEGV